MKKVYFGMNKVSDCICKVLCALIIAVVIANAGSVLLQVLNRYVIVKISDLSFPWTEEFARYSMIWLCYLALPIVYREGSMAQLDLLFERVGKKGKMFLYILTRALCIIFIFIAVTKGLDIVKTRMVFKSPMMRLPGWFLYSAPIFGCLMTLYEIITELIGVFAGELEPFYAGEKRPYPKPEGGDSL